MVHVEDEFIGEDGEIDWAGALSDGTGLAVLGIFFYVDPMKPQVRLNINFLSLNCKERYIL